MTRDYSYGHVRVGTAVPRVHVAYPSVNVAEMRALAAEAASAHVQVLLFPELCITGYTCGDLFHQLLLQRSAEDALAEFLATTRQHRMITVVGMPLRVDDQLFNVAVVCCAGRILGIIPKTYLPGYKEFYEPRWFAAAQRLRSREVVLCGQRAPIGTDLIVAASNIPYLRLAVEICEDLWMPIPPSAHHALHDALLLLNLSASNEIIGKAAYRRDLVAGQSARCIAAYAYASCGDGESTSTVCFGGHCLIAENGAILAESERFRRGNHLTIADVDLERLARERTMTGSFGQAVAGDAAPYRTIMCEVEPLDVRAEFFRKVNPHPFIPDDPQARDAVCEDIVQMESHALVHLLEERARMGSRHPTVSIGLSGGLDSTLALLVTVRAFQILGWDRRAIIVVTMPGFGTTDRTRGNAETLCEALGIPIRTISIVAATLQHLRDIGHLGADEQPHRKCLTCQNAQARERMQILMDLGFVIATGDLSELALGWCTYGADQFGMYAVNCGLPKELIQYVVRWFSDREALGGEASAVLRDILATPISPELERVGADGAMGETTEEQNGPYELHGFFLHHMLRNGYEPEKVVFLAERAFTGTYDRATILRWLHRCCTRFPLAQYKRDTAPNGPKVGSVAVTRYVWQAPADVDMALWVRRIERMQREPA